LTRALSPSANAELIDEPAAANFSAFQIAGTKQCPHTCDMQTEAAGGVGYGKICHWLNYID
jgi:hypothetical protein